MERIKSRSHAHGVMPRHRERPPHQSPQSPLRNRQRNNVAVASEEPGHCCSPDERQRNENRIRPMEPSKDGAGKKTSADAIFGSRKKSIGEKGIQPYLLKQAKRHVTKEVFGDQKMAGRAMESTEKKAQDTESRHQWDENHTGPQGGAPQIVSPPAKRLGSVSVNEEADQQPDGKHDPRLPVRILELPNVPGNKNGKGQHLRKVEGARDLHACKGIIPRSVPRPDD
jgi:hypothetical protein